jgi:hypothetical protein
MITLPSGLLAIQSQGHAVKPRLYTRMPVGGAWIEMQVVEATVTFAEPGEFPSRTLDATVLLDTTDGQIITESWDTEVVDWAHMPLCPLGSWVKAEQVITRPGQPDSTYTVSWGVYRVDSLDVDELTGSVRFTCSDASAQIADRRLVTLAMGRVKKTDKFQARMNTMVADVFSGNIIPWWTGANFVNLALVADRAYGGTGVQFDEDRMGALAELGSSLAAGWRLVCPRATNLGLLRLINPGGGELGTVIVAAGTNLVYAEFSDAVDREDLFNEVLATYTWTGAGGFGRQVTQQRRYIAQYNDVGEEIRVAGPFGYVTRDAINIDIPEGMTSANADLEAEKQSYEAIGRSMFLSRDISVSTSPIYGIEQGDRVLLRLDKNDPGQGCTLVGATIPLHAGGGAWRLSLRLTKLIDAGWKPRYYKGTDETTYDDSGLEWVDFNPNAKAVDQTDGKGDGTGKHNNVNRKWRGWHWSGASTSKGGATLLLTSSSGNITLWTDRGWTGSAAQRRYKASASLTAPHGAIKARVGVDTLTQGVIWGAWSAYGTGKTVTVAVDTTTRITTGSTNFGVRIETSGMKAKEQVRVNSIAVQFATWSAS